MNINKKAVTEVSHAHEGSDGAEKKWTKSLLVSAQRKNKSRRDIVRAEAIMETPKKLSARANHSTRSSTHPAIA